MPQRPDTVFLDMHRWIAKLGDKAEEMVVSDIGNRFEREGLAKLMELLQAQGKGVDGFR